MSVIDSRYKQNLLNDIIRELSTKLIDEKEQEIYLDRLRNVYDGEFKHRYSEFYPIIIEIFKDDNGMDSDYLASNLYELSTYLEASSLDPKYLNIKKPFTKLCDHLNLQIGQFGYYNKNNRKIQSTNKYLKRMQIQMDHVGEMIEYANKQMVEAEQRFIDIEQKSDEMKDNLTRAEQRFDEMEEQLKKATQKLKKVKNQVKSSQMELISVLSIFAAIVITFASGFGFLGNSLSSLNDVEYYEVVILVMIICGMVIFNTIFLLMFLMARITGKNITTRCNKSTCNDCMNCVEKCTWFSRVYRRLPYVFYFNGLSLAGILINMIVWVVDLCIDYI